ncbi:hypothetical protein D3C86_1505700 [compost metagenome]
MLAQHAFQRAHLVAAVGGLAVERVDFGEARAGFLLDRRVQFDEGDALGSRQRPAQRGFAGAAQADQRDAAMPRIARFRRGQGVSGCFAHAGEVAGRQLRQPLHQLRELGGALAAGLLRAARRGGVAIYLGQYHGQRHVQRAGHVAQQQHGGVAGAGFQVGEVAFGHPRATRKILAGHAARRAQRADALPEVRQIGIALGGAVVGVRFGIRFGIQ